MQSPATTAAEYLDELPEDRRHAIKAVRSVILSHLPPGYEEGMQYGMITCVVPLSLYPAGYLNDKTRPLPYASLASQKRHMAVYLMNIYGDAEAERWFANAYRATGKRMDMGKSCVRFGNLDDLPLELVGEAIARTSVVEFIRKYESSRRS